MFLKTSGLTAAIVWNHYIENRIIKTVYLLLDTCHELFVLGHSNDVFLLIFFCQ